MRRLILAITIGLCCLIIGLTGGYLLAAATHQPPVVVTPTPIPTVTKQPTPKPTVKPTVKPTATPTLKPTATATKVAFTVSSVGLTVAPTTIATIKCGTSVKFVYSATFQLPIGNPGGTIHFQYTTTNGRGTTTVVLVIAAGQTTKVFSFFTTGVINKTHTFPGVAEVMVTSPNAVHSPQILPVGVCK